MNVPVKARTFGIATGIAVFVVAILYATIAANKPPSEPYSTPDTINESIIAPADKLGIAFAAVAAHIKPAVISVYSEKVVKVQSPEFPFDDELFERFLGRQLLPRLKQYSIPQRGMGSGMILDTSGHILTNYHVVSEVDEIKIQLADKRIFKAQIIGTDPKTDVAIIKIVGDIPNNLPTVQLGNSDALSDGHIVMAIGAPFGLTQTVTHGIISAKGRSDVGIAAYEDFLQTDTPINPGNSGGPLVNMHGEVVGMNSAIATGGNQFGGEGQSAGVGFAIPSNMIKALLPTLIKGGKITRGMLGVVVQDLNEDLATHFHLSENNGALVSQVNKDSPAEKSGIKSGDIIVRFNNQEVSNTRQLRNLVAATIPGNTVKLEVIREGKKLTFNVTIAKVVAETTETPSRIESQTNPLTSLGMSLQTLTPELAQQLGLQGETGVIITGVEGGSIASISNLKEGDLILEANQTPVRNVEELQNIMSKAHEQILLLIRRNGTNVFVLIRLK